MEVRLGAAHGVLTIGIRELRTAQLLSAVDRWLPDAVLAEIRMPPDHHPDGITAAHTIREKYRNVGVVVLSQHANAAYALELLKYGSAGLAYLLKDRLGDVSHLLDAIRAALPTNR